jgi:hypothetical protein
MDSPIQLTQGNVLAFVQLLIAPAVIGTLSYFVMLRSKMGRLRIQRLLMQDESTGRPIWKIVATALGRPVHHCTVRVAGKTLRWDGVGNIALDIGSHGIGMARVPFQADRGSRVVVKSGPFLVFRSKFGLIEEVCLSNGTSG